MSVCERCSGPGSLRLADSVSRWRVGTQPRWSGSIGNDRCNRYEEAVAGMHVRDGMSTVVLTVGPGHTLRQAATLMAERKVGAAVVVDPEAAGPGIITERD